MKNILFSTSTGFLVNWNPETGSFDAVYDLGRFYTDIAVAPDGQVYGITFDSLYLIDMEANSDQLIGRLSGELFYGNNGLNQANAFDISPAGVALIASNNNSVIARVDLSTGAVSNAGLMLYTESAGDLIFLDDSVFVSTTSSTLVELKESATAS